MASSIVYVLKFTTDLSDINIQDLKPENIGIDASGDPIIFDFGLARAITNLSITRKQGTLNYMAPEFFHLNNTAELSKRGT